MQTRRPLDLCIQGTEGRVLLALALCLSRRTRTRAQVRVGVMARVVHRRAARRM